MKSAKSTRKKKPVSIPEFFDYGEMPYPVNLRLAEYGKTLGLRQDAIGLVESILLWREHSLPNGLIALKDAPETAKDFEANVKSRVALGRLIEEKIENNDTEFFETIASVLKRRRTNRPPEHAIELRAWKEFYRLLWASARPSRNPAKVTLQLPTKKELQDAIETTGNKVTNPARLWKRLKLDKWLLDGKRGPNRNPK